MSERDDMAVGDGSVKSGGHYWIGKDIDDFDMDKFLATFKENLIGKMGAKSCKAGSYKTILKREAFQQFFMVFFGNFLATTMQRGLSLLADKEGTQIERDNDIHPAECIDCRGDHGCKNGIQRIGERTQTAGFLIVFGRRQQ